MPENVPLSPALLLQFRRIQTVLRAGRTTLRNVDVASEPRRNLPSKHGMALQDRCCPRGPSGRVLDMGGLPLSRVRS